MGTTELDARAARLPRPARGRTAATSSRRSSRRRSASRPTKVNSAFDGLHAEPRGPVRREARRRARRGHREGEGGARQAARATSPHSPGDFAQSLADELGLEASDVQRALAKIGPPFGAPGRTARGRRPPRPRAAAAAARNEARREPSGPARRVPLAARRGEERLEAGAAGARQVPGRPLQPRPEHGAGRAGRRGAATKVTASAGTTRPSHSSLRRLPPPSRTGGGSSSRTRPTPTARPASGSHGPPRG